MPFCLSWQTGGSGLHPQHHCDHASSHQQQHHLISDTTQSASLWSLHHLICIIVIIHHLISIIVISSSSHHFYCDHFIISIFVIIASSHQHHCDHASPASLFAGCLAMVTACVLAAVMTNDGGQRCCDAGHCPCHQTEYPGRRGHGRQWVVGSPLVLQTKAIRRFVITEKAPTRAFSWLKAATTAFTFKTLLRHYAPWHISLVL